MMMRKISLFAVGAMLAAGIVSAKTCTWRVASGDAAVAANWDGGLPGATDDAVLTSGVMTVSTDFSVASLTNDNGVLLMSGGTFSVGRCVLGAATGKTGSVLLEGGTLAAGALSAGEGEGGIVAAGGALRVAGKAANVGDLPGVRLALLSGKTLTLDTDGGDVRLVQNLEKALDASNLTHRWSFNNMSLMDSVTRQSATTSGKVDWDSTKVCLQGSGSTEACVMLGSIFDGCTTEFTVEMWFILVNPVGWSRMFYACNDEATKDLKLYPSRGGNLDEWRLWVDSPTKPSGVQVFSSFGFSTWKGYHVSLTGRHTPSGWQITMHKRDGSTGALIDKETLTAPTDWDLSDMNKSALGHALAGASSGLSCYFNEVRVWKTALSDSELSKSVRLGPDAAFGGETGSLVKTGAGALALEGKNACVGAATVSAGTLAAGEALRPSHRWSFWDSSKRTDGRVLDSEGGRSVSKSGSTSWEIEYQDEGVLLPGLSHGGAYLALGTGSQVFNGCEKGFTVEMWATCLDRTGQSWPRIVSIFSNGSAADVLSMGCTHASDPTRDIICTYYGDVKKVFADNLAPYADDTEYHIAFSVYPGATVGAWNATFYKQSASGETLKKFDVALPNGWTPQCLTNSTAYLGYSPDPGQSDAHVRYAECRIWPAALTEAELSRLGAAGKATAALLRTAAPRATTANLTHRWSFNNSLADSVGGNTAVITGDKIKLGTSTLTLGASASDYVELGSVFGDCTEAFTLEMWYRQTGHTGWSYPFKTESADGKTAFWFYSSNGGWVQPAATTPQINVKAASGNCAENLYGFYFNESSFYHVAVTGARFETGWQLVVSGRDLATGELIASRAITPKSDWDPTLMTVFDLGKSSNMGIFDEIRVWNRVLSNAELTRNVLAGPDAIPSFDRGLPATATLSVAGGATFCGNDVSVATLSGAGSFLGSYVLGAESVLDLSETLPAAFGDLTFTGGATVKVAQKTLAAGAGVPVGALKISGANVISVVSGGEALRPREVLFAYESADIDSSAAWTVTGGKFNSAVADRQAQQRLLLRSPMGLFLFLR